MSTKKLTGLFCLFLVTILVSFNLKKPDKAVKIYPYGVIPEEYPDFSRRPFKTPTWETFDSSVQFVGGRSWGNTFGIIDGKAPNWMEGAKVMRPNVAHFRMGEDSLRTSLLRFKKDGYYLFNINAYGPGTPVNGGFGQFMIEPWKTKMMKDILGDRYMGFDLGEQDGRYWADCRSIDFPMSEDYQERYLNAMKYMHRAAIDQGDPISMLSVKWFWHYPMKDGFVSISGAETQNKTYTSNGQVHYSFLRGASKQYGLLWYGDISVYNSWGAKSYGRNSSNKGNSVSWMKRMLFSQYQFNSTILGFEGSLFYRNRQDQEIKLSPIGMLQRDMQEFIIKYPKPGPQHTPVALFMDFFSGWMTPSEPFSDKYKVWNFLPYKKGDFFVHNVLNMFYNGYDQNGLHKNEYGGLCNTPYGDELDILLSDARISILSRYPMVLVAGEIKTDMEEVIYKLERYTEQGGHLVITSENARKLFPYLRLKNTDDTFATKMVKKGRGEMTIIYCKDMGIDKDNRLNMRIALTLDSMFRATRLFSVGDSLGYITNIEGDGKYMLGIYNNTLKSKPFSIQTHVGEIKSIEELKTVRDLTKEPGYFPEGFEDTETGLWDEGHIAAGDVRLFFIKVDEKKVEYLPESHPENRVTERYLSVPTLIGLEERLQTMPTFFDYFSGIKISWKEVLEINEMKFREDAWWYNMKQLQVTIEFDRDFLNKYNSNKSILTQIAKTINASKHIDLLVFSNDYPEKIRDEITNSFAGANTVTKGSSKVLIAGAGKIVFPKPGEKPIIIDQNYSTWDEIYPVAKAMDSGGRYNVTAGNWNMRKKGGEMSNSKQENLNYFFSHHDDGRDISSVLQEEEEYLSHFGGVKIDGTYLYSRSMEKCMEEASILKEAGITMIVDLCREINNYPDLTWLSEIEHAYKCSVLIHRDILNKMEMMGIKNVIISSHMRPEQWSKTSKVTAEESIIAGISSFVKEAENSGITVSIQNAMYRHYPSRLLAKPVEVSKLVTDLRKKYNNVKCAAHLGLGEDPIKLITGFKDNMNICIVAAEGSDIYDYRIPFSKSDNNVKFMVDRKVIMVFDADYKSVNELIADKSLIQQFHLD